MTKQEQIEEIQQVLSKFFEETPMELSFNHDNGEVDIIKDKQALKVLDDITRQALIPMFSQVLVEQGYRKLPKDAVILTKEEYIDLSRNYVKEQKEQAVKEFAEKLKERVYTNNYCQEVILKSEIDELLKEYKE